MATEIERKFLVANDDWRQQVLSQARIKQGYLANQKTISVRVRVIENSALLTIKGATDGIRRAEYEYPIPVDDAEQMLSDLAAGPVVDKTRYRVRCGAHTWDLDVFAGENQGLVMAEVELQAEDELFEKPSWAGEEVSQDPRYFNSSLVRHPFSRW